jgi:hypothetical protein
MFYKSQNHLKPRVLNYLFRYITFLDHREKIRTLTDGEYGQLFKDIEIPVIIIHKFISRFLVDLIRFRKFLASHPNILSSKSQDRIVRICLHKLYHLAPVFNYRRAKENAKRLKSKLDRLCFWPQVMTQVAIVIYITDLLDSSYEQKIIQTNLRTLCSCSAYAFHRTRNKLGLTTEYTKTIQQ